MLTLLKASTKDLKLPSIFQVHPSDKALLNKERRRWLASLPEKKFQLSFKEERAVEREHRENIEEDGTGYEGTGQSGKRKVVDVLAKLGRAMYPRPRRRILVQVSVSPYTEEMDIRPDFDDIDDRMEEDDPDVVMSEIDLDVDMNEIDPDVDMDEVDPDIDMSEVDPDFEMSSPAPIFPPGLDIASFKVSRLPDIPEIFMTDDIEAVDIEMDESAGIAECVPAPGQAGHSLAAAAPIEGTKPITTAVANAGSDNGKIPETAAAPSLGSTVIQDLPSGMLFYPRTPKPTAENLGYIIDSWYDTPKPAATAMFASTIDATEEPISLALHYPDTPKPTVESPGYIIDSWYDTPTLAATATFTTFDTTAETIDDCTVYSEPSDYTFGSDEGTFVEGPDDVQSEVKDVSDGKGGEQPSWLTVYESTSAISLAGSSSAWSLVSS